MNNNTKWHTWYSNSSLLTQLKYPQPLELVLFHVIPLII